MSVLTIDPKKYQLGTNYPAPYLPPSLQDRLTKSGGLNLYGEPNFRFVWGCAQEWYRMNGWRMKYIVGNTIEWTEHQTKAGVFVKNARRIELGTPRWIIEVWQPPEFFGTPDHWNHIRYEMIDGVMFDKIGEFPSRGDYRHFLTIEDEDGEYKLPDESDMQFMEEAIYTIRNEQPNPEQETRDTIQAIDNHRLAAQEALNSEIDEAMKLHGRRIDDPYRWKRGGTGNKVFHNSEKQFTGETSAIRTAN